MKHMKRTLSAFAAAGLLFSLRPASHAVTRSYIDPGAVSGSGGSSGILASGLVVLFILAAMIFFVRQGRSGRINVPWAVMSVLLAGLAMMLCVVGTTSGTVYTKVDGDPAESVRGFYDAVIARDYETAYTYLSDYASLGLEKEPESENAKLAYEALRASYDYSISGEAVKDGMEATVKLRFRFLDMPSFEESVASRTNDNLRDIVESRPVSEVYDENEQYKSEVTQEAYAEALSFILDKADSYYSSKELDVKLIYRDSSWLIVTDEEMLKALMGNTIYR